MALSTPEFSLSQDATHVFVDVRPAQDADLSTLGAPRAVAEGVTFGLIWGQSYLPLVLPHTVHSQPTCLLDEEGRKARIALRKEQPGLHWAHLDALLPQILPEARAADEPMAAPGDGSQPQAPESVAREMLAQAVGRENAARGQRGQGRIIELDNAPVDGEEEMPSSFRDTDLKLCAPGVPESLATQVHEAPRDDAQADSDADWARRQDVAEERENAAFDEGWYLDNHVDENQEVLELLDWKLPRDARTTLAVPAEGPLRPEHLLLIELLFAAAYEARTTQGEATVESGWTIASLCRSLVVSALPRADSVLAHTLRSSFRRALCRPLYRSWRLCDRATEDVAAMLRDGRGSTAQHLDSIAQLLREGADAALPIYARDTVEPLSRWLRSDPEASDAKLAQLASQYLAAQAAQTKQSVGGDWDLEELEQAAQAVLDEEAGINQ